MSKLNKNSLLPTIA